MTANKDGHEKSYAEVAAEVVIGEWGTGDECRKKLGAAGYDYDAVKREIKKIEES